VKFVSGALVSLVWCFVGIFFSIRAIRRLLAVVRPLPDEGGLSLVSSVFTDYFVAH